MNPRQTTLEQWAWITGVSLFCLLLSPTQHVLDEETYLWIAEQMTWLRPYDWRMPFPPFYSDGFVFAHPPLFLWWVKAVGDSWFTGLPWLMLWWWAVVRLFESTLSSWRTGVLVMLGCSSALLPMMRVAMPDLMMSALALTGLVQFAMSSSASSSSSAMSPSPWSAIGGGVMLGLAAWTKYPALVLLLVPLLTSVSLKRILWCWLGAGLIIGSGEVWLWLTYEQWHIVEVIEQSRLVGRSPFTSRLVGIPVRLGLSLMPFVLIRLVRYPLQTAVYVVLGVVLLQNSAGIWLGLGLGLLMQCVKSTAEPIWRWGIALVLIGILVGHNYVAPRYWLVTVPMWWVIFHPEWTRLRMSHLQVVLGVSLLVSGGLWYTERQHSEALATLMDTALEDRTIQVFSGEWGTREKAQAAGLSQYQGNSRRLLISHNAAGWIPHEADGWSREARFEGASSYCRLVSQAESVGYYADSLGQLPIICSMTAQPIEVVEIWKRP